MLKSQGAGILEPRTDSRTIKKTTQMTSCNSIECMLQLVMKQKVPLSRVGPLRQYGQRQTLTLDCEGDEGIPEHSVGVLALCYSEQLG